MQILTFNWHEAYLWLLAKTGHAFHIVLREKGYRGHKAWFHQFRPVPPGARLIEEAEAREQWKTGAYDLILCHDPSDLAVVLDCPAPKILVLHNRASTVLAMNRYPGSKEKYLAWFRELLEASGPVRLVYISERKREDWGIPGEVIPPGLDLSEYGGYRGDQARVLRIGNGFRERDLMLGYTEQERILRGLPSTVIGINPTIPGARLSASWYELKSLMRSHRLYLHTTKDPWEDGYNLALLEAMATGMPVVALANRTSPIVDGENGFVSDDLDVLHDRVRFLLEHPEEARRLGEAARRTVEARFPIRGFVEAWNRVLAEAVRWKASTGTRPAPRTASPPADRSEVPDPAPEPPRSTAPRPKPETRRPKRRILLSYCANPTTTAAYLERALRKHHEVITYGPDIVGYGMPLEGGRIEPIWKVWDLGLVKDRVKPHDIPFQDDDPDLRNVLKRLPGGWTPDLFLWVDSGNYFSLEGMENLPCLKVAYFIDSHLELARHLEMAKAFDVVFVAQRAYLPDFEKAGCRHVHWLPLACDPEIHRPHDLPKRYDVGFVGSLTPYNPRRKELLERLKQHVPVHVTRCFLEDMARVFSQSKIVFNQCIRNDLNMRVFEALACGSLLLTDEADGLSELFQDRKHLVVYRDERELVALAKHYLEHPEEREAIAQAGRAEVLARHTYAHRVEEMLRVIASVQEGQGQAQEWDTHPEAVVLQPYCVGKGIDVGCGFRKTHPDAIGIDLLGKGEIGDSGCMKDQASVADIQASGDELVMFQDGELDYVVSRHNLEHYVDVVKTLREWKRVLKVGGVLGMVLPDESQISTIALDPTHKHVFTPESIKSLLDLVGGFEIERMDTVIPNWSFVVIARRVAEPPSGTSHGGVRMHLEYAAKAVEEGRWEAARTAYELALAMEPENAKALSGLGLAHFGAGRMEEALAALRESLSKDPDQPAALHYLVQAASATGRLEDTLPHFRAYIRLRPGDAHMGFAYAGLCHRLGNRGEAQEVLERLLLLSPDHPEAKALLQEIQAQKPTDPTGREEGRCSAASPPQPSGEEAEEPARASPNRAPATEATAGDPVSSLCRTATEALRRGNLPEARRLFQQAASLNGHTPEPYLGLGAVAIQETAYSEARTWYERALALDPQSPKAWFGLALAHWGEGDKEASFRCCCEAAERDPDNPALVCHLLQAAHGLERLEAAWKPMREYLRLHPADADMLYGFAGVCIRLGRIEEARETLERLRLVAPQREDLADLEARLQEAGTVS